MRALSSSWRSILRSYRSCFFGYYAKNGAEGVGKATTSTVVISCIVILILDYLLAEILL